ncbi:MAG TPA: aldehyde dehydrogenase family protein, partial [Rhodocyclaceae bacterium]
AALVTGNAALMKPALPGLQSALALRAAMDAVGLPRDVCPLLIGDADLGRALVAHSAVEIIAFTGSRAVGLDILHEAHTPRSGQRHIKQVVCEMGGKNAIVVDADADLDEAVGGILTSAFSYSGQKCSACSRVIAVEAIAPSLQQRLMAAAATLRWGDPADPSCDHGPLISAAARQKALDYIAIGGQEAHLLWQGSVPQGDGSGWYCPPTIFTEVRPEHRIAREEIFGPVLALMTAPDFATALAIANNCDYALTGGVYSRLPRHLALARDEFRVGNLYLNRRTTGARVGIQPFGGIALSGTGIQAGGPDYLKQFMWMQSSSENIMRKGFVPGGE